MRKIFFAILLGALSACAPSPNDITDVQDFPNIFPDYVGVTIPIDIAPLNFSIDSADYVFAVARGNNGTELKTSGEFADFDIDLWHQLTRQNAGDSISISVTCRKNGKWLSFKPFYIIVSNDSLNEFGLTYRKIKPGYETFSDIGIFQRDIHTFDEFAIVDHTALQGECINCHVSNRCNANEYQLHVRGGHSATLVNVNGEQRLLNTATDKTIANCMYAYWHPSGRYVAYSLNLVNQCFWEDLNRHIEVFDLASDALVLDLKTNELVLSPELMTKDFETFPVFSADGKFIYYCTSKPYMDQGLLDSMRYDLCRVEFDTLSGKVVGAVDTIIPASQQLKSITHPRPSYDGKYLMYSCSDYSVFPIHHPESDLWILDLTTNESRNLYEVNSDKAESFHNWSTNSRWFVFNSKRLNSSNNLLYIAHFAADGKAGKPFLLPQRNPRKFYSELLHSYNVPDFTYQKVDLNIRQFADDICNLERIQVKTR